MSTLNITAEDFTLKGKVIDDNYIMRSSGQSNDE